MFSINIPYSCVSEENESQMFIFLFIFTDTVLQAVIVFTQDTQHISHVKAERDCDGVKFRRPNVCQVSQEGMSQYTGSATGGAIPQTVSKRNTLMTGSSVSLRHHHQKRHQAAAVV